MLIDCSSVYALIVVNDKNYIQYLTRENYGVFYHDWRNYGREKICRGQLSGGQLSGVNCRT